MTPDPSDSDLNAAMDELRDHASSGAVMEMLPRGTDPNIAIGIATALAALQDGNKQVARASLELVVDELDT